MAMRRRTRRLVMIIAALCVALGAATLIGYGLSGNITLFVTPTQAMAGTYGSDQLLRIGGLVEAESVIRSGKSTRFAVTDRETSIHVEYNDIPPDLFREEQGIVVEGFINVINDRKVLIATSVLAKHDENYMPKEVIDSLKESGNWQGGSQ